MYSWESQCLSGWQWWRLIIHLYGWIENYQVIHQASSITDGQLELLVQAQQLWRVVSLTFFVLVD